MVIEVLQLLQIRALRWLLFFPLLGFLLRYFGGFSFGNERGWGRELSGLIAGFALQLGFRKLCAVGGEGEIRAPESLEALALFESARINHSRTSPY